MSAPERWFLCYRGTYGTWLFDSQTSWLLGEIPYTGYYDGWTCRDDAEQRAKQISGEWVVVGASELTALESMERARVTMEGGP